MTLPVLYSFRRCPYAMRARMVLLLVEQPVVVREILLRDKPDEFLTLSEKGTVPVMCLPDGVVLDESLAIMNWAIEAAGNCGGLCTSHMQMREELIARNDNDFKYWLDRYKYHVRYPEHSEEYFRGQAMQFISDLDKLLARTDFLVSNKTSIADIAIMPFVRQFAMVDAGWFAESPYPNIKRWLQAWLVHQVFTVAMTKYPQWVEGNSQENILRLV